MHYKTTHLLQPLGKKLQMVESNQLGILECSGFESGIIQEKFRQGSEKILNLEQLPIQLWQ